ncbi:MAG: MFS transporter [Candidatus Nezhaarchaeota archaeon]|nr:MFS transporter [Candidatus Nezhaarchaeota archaeon]
MRTRWTRGPSLNILLLGLTSLLADFSTEMMAPALPLFIASLGGAGLAVSLAGGLGDGASSLLRLLSGYASDRLGGRRRLMVIGYSTSAITKLLTTLAGSWAQVVGLRVADRLGKGVRTPPRDALIYESTPAELSGRAFGLHRAMDTSGAVLGSLAALLLLGLAGLEFRLLFAAAGLVGLLAVIPLLFVKEPAGGPRTALGLRAALAELPSGLRKVLSFTTLFAAGNVSYMLLLLRASLAFEEHLALLAPLALYLAFNCVYASSTYLMGAAADKLGRVRVLTAGYVAIALSLAGLAWLPGPAWVVASFATYSLGFSCVDTVERVVVAEASRGLRGTGMGAYHCLSGLAAIAGGVVAGLLWDLVSPSVALTYASLATLIAAVGMGSLAYKLPQQAPINGPGLD